MYLGASAGFLENEAQRRQNNNEKIANTRMGNTRKDGSGFPMDSYPNFQKKGQCLRHRIHVDLKAI